MTDREEMEALITHIDAASALLELERRSIEASKARTDARRRRLNDRWNHIMTEQQSLLARKFHATSFLKRFPK